VNSDLAPILSAAEIAYQAIQQDTADNDPPQVEEEDPLIEPVWVVNSFASRDCLDMVLPSDEAIMEAQTGPETPWEDLHHRSYFLPDLDKIENEESPSPVPEHVGQPLKLSAMQGIYAEGNMQISTKE